MLVKTESVDMIAGEQSSNGWSGELVQKKRGENLSTEAELLPSCVKQSLTWSRKLASDF